MKKIKINVLQIKLHFTETEKRNITRRATTHNNTITDEQQSC